MKKLKSLLILVLTLSMMTAGMVVSVSADEATDLKSMKVYAVDASGNKTEVKMDFKSTTYTYELTVMSNTESISIEADTVDSTSTWSIEKDGINTKMDFGRNYTAVKVESASGATETYILNTTKLTEAEEATYEAEESESSEEDNEADNQENKNDGEKVVKVGKKKMKISSSFDEDLIPEGFKTASAEYDGEEYTCIKGEVKDITAFYLYNDNTEGFYIYHSADSSFEKMYNIKIKSRMYTIVTPETVDTCLKNYSKKNVTIIDQEVKAWVLDEEQGMYLVYAMNWNGDTSLYCYDDNEKCFQRYLVEADSNTQMEAANSAYETLQNKYNKLVTKYNLLLKIVCGLAIVIIILIFVIINLALSKKEKKAKKARESEEFESGIPYTLEEDNEESINDTETNDKFDRTYGDEPTFGIDSLSDELGEGFYGGEVKAENEVLIDIADDELQEELQLELEEKMKAAQLEAEEDLKETLKSMLPDEEDATEEDDDDFEFIELN